MSFVIDTIMNTCCYTYKNTSKRQNNGSYNAINIIPGAAGKLIKDDIYKLLPLVGWMITKPSLEKDQIELEKDLTINYAGRVPSEIYFQEKVSKELLYTNQEKLNYMLKKNPELPGILLITNSIQSLISTNMILKNL